MPIAVICPACKARMKAPDALIGKVVRCPGCSAQVRIPAVTVPAAAPSPDEGIRQGPAPASAVRPPAGPVVERLEEVPDEEEIADVLPAEETDDDQVEEVEEEVDDLEVVEGRPRRKKGGKKARGVTENDCTLAMLLYLSSFLFGFLGPLIIWLVKKAESPFIDHHGKSALNFIFSVGFPSIGVVVTAGGMLMAVGGPSAFGIWVLMLIILALLGLYSTVMIFIAALKAKDGEWFELPTWLRLFQ
jgi:uncharacterized Tic20 family protein